MKKYLLLILLSIAIIIVVYLAVLLNKGVCPLISRPVSKTIEYISTEKSDTLFEKASLLLKSRKDNEALAVYEEILSIEPANIDALWGKAEVLRRSRDYGHSEDLLNQILKINPGHVSSLISLSFIRYKDTRLNEALQLVKRALKAERLDNDNEALGYVMLGMINSRRSQQGWFFEKITYGMQIKRHFLKAKALASDLPEISLALGTFYLLAPPIAGGNLEEALKELDAAVKIAPDFATVNARLAQAYKKKGDLDKYNFYLKKTRELDPENEVLRELNI
ncbi:MAG: tetratricopeptide repeat protein [Candidatus Omnitrophica bacterium]|nr:tetratricopeptide repeat protein [Candidatus Omnitrophota bacterium]MDD5237741.1 tetratricopeptide repeat protein [Candidatus Omnitrophota bacterium]